MTRLRSARGSELFDLELEVGVVYGERGRNLTPEQAAGGMFEELISFASRGSVVAPGDVLASGTLPARLPDRDLGPGRRARTAPLVPGDVVTLEVEGLGLVRNKIVEPAACPPIPQARRGQPRGPRH